MSGQGSNGLSWATREELEIAYESLARENAVLRAQLEGAHLREAEATAGPASRALRLSRARKRHRAERTRARLLASAVAKRFLRGSQRLQAVPAPRYDDVFWEGCAALDRAAEEE